jgi:biotin carboxyl carrier protein
MTTTELEAAGQALIADLTTAFGTLTPDKAVAFFPGVPVDDQIVQNGVVNTLRLAQWLATFDTPLVLRPGQAETTAPPGGASATAIYSAIVTGARAVDANSPAGQQLTQRIRTAKTLFDQVAPDEPLGSEPPDWPLPDAPSWRTVSTSPTQARPDPADPANTVVRLPSLGGIPDGSSVIVTWSKKVGDSVQAGEALAWAETAKVEDEIPSPAAGTLLEITTPDGGIVKAGDPIAIIGPGPPAPAVIVGYQYALVSLTRRIAGTPWWDDVLLSDQTWFIPGRTVGGLLPAPTAGMVNALPYALLVVRNVVISSPSQPPPDVTRLGPVLVSNTGAAAGNAGPFGWVGLQAVGLVANVLPPLPPKDDPTPPKNGVHLRLRWLDRRPVGFQIEV